MTIEETLVVLLALVAGLLLFFGLSEAFDDDPRSRLLARRRGRRPRNRRARLDPPAAGQTWGAGSSGVPSESRRFPVSPSREVAAGLGALHVTGTVTSVADPELALLEIAVACYERGKPAELLAAAEPYLHGHAPGPSHGATALSTLAGFAHQALGEHAAARTAFEAAVSAAPDGDWPASPARLMGLAIPLARRLLEMAERSPEGAEDRIMGPQLARAWLGWRRSAVPGDRAAAALLEHAGEVLVDGYWNVVNALIRRQDFGEARRLIQGGMDRKELADDRSTALLAFLSSSLTDEIGRLTTPAIWGTTDERQAVLALETARAMLGSPPAAALTAEQRAAAIRRLWRGHAKLALRRSGDGRPEPAVEALLQALGIRGIDERRRRYTRAALVRALERMAEQAAQIVGRRLRDGNRPAALEEARRLVRLVQRARDEGIPADELLAVASRARRLMEQIEQVPA